MDQPIIITGFMGAGKTTVAHALAHRLNCSVIDLDRMITGKELRSPKEIIEQDGEPAFRDVETRRLREALALEPRGVIALGGGAWTLQRNRDLVVQHQGYTVWLDAPFELCWQRIVAGESERPLAPNEEQARGLYAERRHFYELASLHLIADGKMGVDELATIIAGAFVKTE
jgi:shikimate kinase